MRFYLGPWQWLTSPIPHWAPPAGFAALDLRTLAQMSQQGGAPGLGLFCGEGIITDSDYLSIGQGSFYDLKPGQVVRDAFPKRSGYTVKGDDLVGIIVDLLTDGADPDGLECSKPLMPGMNGRLALHLGGQHHFHRFRVGYGHWSHCRDLLRRDLKRTILAGRAEAAELRALATAISGKTWQQVNQSSDPVIVRNRPLLVAIRNRGLTVAQAVTFLGARADRVERQYRKILDFTLEKYGIDKTNWRDLCPQDIVGELDPPEPHETTIADDFNRADASGSMGTASGGFSWSNVAGTCGIASNKGAAETSDSAARADSDLSSDDHYSQAELSIVSGTADHGVASRFASAANTHYLFLSQATPRWSLYKRVTGAFTELAANSTGFSAPVNNVYRLECDGSDLECFDNGVSKITHSDASITGNVRTGLAAFGAQNRWDNFEAADLGGGGGGIVYTQLERNVRGVSRGIYTDF